MSTKLKPMRSAWWSLLWKEWHEHKWHMVGLSVVLVVLPLVFMGNDPQTLLVTTSMSLLCYGLLAGLFTGMGTAAGENSRGTMRFLQSLPVGTEKPATARLFLSCLTVIAPICVAVGFAYAYLLAQQYHPLDVEVMLDWTRQASLFSTQTFNGIAGYSLMLALLSSLVTASLLVWMAAFGVNRSDEVRAGAIGFLVIAFVWLCILAAQSWLEWVNWTAGIDVLTVIMAAAPGGPGLIASLSTAGFGTVWPYVVFSFLVHAYLIRRYLRRYGRGASRSGRPLGSATKTVPSGWLLPPRRSQLSAIIWKQVQETGPLVALAAVAAILFAGVIVLLNRYNGFRSSFGETLAGTALGVGYLVTVVAGMGVFLEDVKPKVGIFWRSRPVNVTTWFFVKFFTGLVVLVGCFGSLFLLAYLLPGGRRLLDAHQPAMHATAFALAFLLTYTLSMASYCMGKHPIVAFMATIGIVYSGAVASSVVVNRVLGQWEPELAIGLILVAQIAAMAIAWGALRFNWGWHK